MVISSMAHVLRKKACDKKRPEEAYNHVKKVVFAYVFPREQGLGVALLELE